jgi:single-strand DNA-binding protein
MFNKVLLIGNVVKDAESKSVKNTSVARFRLAVDDTIKKDSVLYIDVEAWDKQAEFAEKWLKKGKGVIVDGRLCMDSWEKDGKKETKIFVKAQDIRFSNVASSNVASSKAEVNTTSKEGSKVATNNSKQNESETSDEFSDVPF